MSSQDAQVTFPNSAGQELAGRLERPLGRARAWAVFAHCFTCSKDIAVASRISRTLVREGLGVLRFDFTGLGGSEGDFANTNFSSNLDDLVAAAAYLRAHERAPALLVGHSLGGAAVLAAAARIPEVRAVAAIGAPSEPLNLRGLVDELAPDVARSGAGLLTLGGKTFRIEAQFLEDLAKHSLASRLRTLEAAVLLLHSPQDEVVGIENARKLYEAARHPKSFISLDGADHLLSRKADSEYAARVLAAWASRYVEPADGGVDALDASGDLPSGSVRVEGRAGSLTQSIQAGRHRFLADEPVESGGDDSGPTPYDFLLSALGVCTSMTLQLYARHKGLPLQRVGVELSHDRIHAEDCADCETKSGRVERIARRLELVGELTIEQRRRMVEIADRCPVHRTLSGEIRIDTELKD